MSTTKVINPQPLPVPATTGWSSVEALRTQLARKEMDNAAMEQRVQLYSDVLVEIAALDHRRSQSAITLAREALKV